MTLVGSLDSYNDVPEPQSERPSPEGISCARPFVPILSPQEQVSEVECIIDRISDHPCQWGESEISALAKIAQVASSVLPQAAAVITRSRLEKLLQDLLRIQGNSQIVEIRNSMLALIYP